MIPETAQPAASCNETVRLAFIVADHDFTPEQFDAYSVLSTNLIHELFGVSTYAPPTPNAGTTRTPNTIHNDTPGVSRTPLVVAAHIDPHALSTRHLHKLGDWARHVIGEARLKEVGVVVGDYYYPFSSIESSF